jgi:hypothetical protein
MDASQETGELAHEVKGKAQEAAQSQPIGWLARFGLASRGAVYLLMGVLALLLALGSAHKEVDQTGVLLTLVSYPAGEVLVALLAIGFAGYTILQLKEAAFGVAGEGRKRIPRLQALGAAIVYGLLTYSAVNLLLGARTSSSERQEGLAAQVMRLTGGQIIVGLAGAAIVGVAAVMAYNGVRCTFMRTFVDLPPRIERPLREIGRLGAVGRAAVFALVGALVVYAAWTFDPEKAGGIDAALKTVLQQPFGRPVVGAAAIALMTFGVYGLLEAMYRRVRPHDEPGDGAAPGPGREKQADNGR